MAESWIEQRNRDGVDLVNRLLSQPRISFEHLVPSSLPNSPGLSAIYEVDQPDACPIRAGRTRSGGLRQRLYVNHLMGNQSGNLRRQLVDRGRVPDLDAAKDWIRANCALRYLVLQDADALIWGEHFMLAMLRPEFGD
ncbi:hypothetical protein KJ567_05970 [Candidatus Bipolaricaulota bacterium]|nr:hypothetical protein [Candidatus Bipolaricaulota bacterium]